MSGKRLKVALYVVRRFKTGSNQLIAEDAAQLLTADEAEKRREELHLEKREGEYAILEVASLETTPGSRWGK